MKPADVLIIGAGPTGLTLAINLIRNGISCKIIDKRNNLNSSASKAITLNAATLKLYHNMEIVDKLIDNGCKVKDIYVHWYNRKLMHVNYGYLDTPYKYFLSIPQPKTESILLQHFLDLGGDVDFSTEITDLSSLDQTNLKATLISNGDLSTYETKFVIGCDGASSKVREIIGNEFAGRDYGIFFELIDVYLKWDGDKLSTHYYVVEDGFVIIIPMTNNMHRIVFKNNIQDFEQMRNEKSIEYYENTIRMCGIKNLQITKILWRSFSKFYNRLIDNYNYDNRIFFAGDACHLFSPIGGLGMNTGVQDAFNLSWRLSGVLSGQSNAKILEEYNMERRFIGQQLVKSTDASTELIMRMNKNSASITNWLPIMKNRNNIQHTLPLNFSGLGHNYQINGNEICHVPFARGFIIKTNKDINTYDLANGMDFNILLFINKINIKDYLRISKPSMHKNIKVWQITSDIDSINHEDNIIFDKYGEFENKFTKKTLFNVIVVRPDGYVGLECNIEDIEKLNSFLAYYFSPINISYCN